MFGQNPIRKANYSSTALRVQEIFKTIQGEGPFAGHPAIFIRLAGCSLRCWFCDTDFESNYHNLMTPREVAEKVKELIGDSKIKLVVFTGGEPMLQRIGSAIICIQNRLQEVHTQIETSGTHCAPALEFLVRNGLVTIVCSPKTGKVNQRIAELTDHWKYVISLSDRGFLRHTQNPEKEGSTYFPPITKNTRIYLQPCDEGPGNEEKSRKNLEQCITLAQQEGFILSLQLHKILGMP